jgi:hypothetical protein
MICSGFFVFGGDEMSQIKSVTPKTDYKLEVFLENGSSIVLNLESRLKTVRFGMLADKEFFRKATTDGSYIRWGDLIEISVNEVFQLAKS